MQLLQDQGAGDSLLDLAAQVGLKSGEESVGQHRELRGGSHLQLSKQPPPPKPHLLCQTPLPPPAAACSHDGTDLVYELPGGSCGGNNSVAHSKVCQEVHSMLTLLSFTLLQQAQKLRVVSNGMGRGEA